METEIKPQLRIIPSHKEMCEMFEIPRSMPAPNWTSYAVQLTVIELVVDGIRRIKYGGAMECGACGFVISMMPDEHTTPKARPDGGCPRCGSLTPNPPEVGSETR